jgi:hypothetical protein
MKKTLLMAAAALAAGVISSQAQPVYSQNIVGYANVPAATAGNSYAVSVPFLIGVSNGANEVFGTSLQGAGDFSQILIWNPNTAQYTAYLSDSGSPSGWDDSNFDPVPAPVLPVGQGFFLVPTIALTNTFVGQVAIAAGTSYTNTYPTAGNSYLVGSVVPYAGSITNGGNSGGGLNLNFATNPSADFTQILIWNPATASYTAYLSDSGSPSGWDDSNFSPVDPPSLNVGDAFFVVPTTGNLQWSQGL